MPFGGFKKGRQKKRYAAHGIRQRFSNDSLSEEDVQQLYDATFGTEDELLIKVGVGTGMRVSEVVQLYIAEINFKEDSLVVHDEKKNVSRKIYVKKALSQALKAYCNTISQEKLFDYSTKTVERKIQYWTREVLGKTKSWHALRHTFATLNSDRGVSVHSIAHSMGDRPATVLQTYVEKNSEAIKRELDEKAL